MVIFFLSYCLLFNKITLNKGSVGTNHLNNRILLFVCNRKVIYYYYITLPSITITITITFGNFQSITITITITGKSGYYYYNYILHITITPSLVGTPHDVYIVGCYRPPSGDNIKFIDRLNITIQELEPDRSIIVLGGDINLDLLKHANVRNISYYLDLLLSYNLFPSITKATRFSTQSRSLLDHIFTNYSQTNSKSHIIVTDISDHFPVLLMNEITVPQRKDTIEKIRLFTHLNIVNFNKDIGNSDWNVVLDIMETQKAYTKFHSIIQSCFERNFPERQYRSSYRTKLPWITDELGKKISLKNKLFYIYKKRPTQVNQEKYKKYKREINKLIRKARR